MRFTLRNEIMSERPNHSFMVWVSVKPDPATPPPPRAGSPGRRVRNNEHSNRDGRCPHDVPSG